MTPLLDNPYLEKVCAEIWANAVPAPRSHAPHEAELHRLRPTGFDRLSRGADFTAYQREVVRLHLLHRQHKEIARALGKTPSGVRRVLRNLAEQGRLPARVQWPVPR